MHSVLPRIKPRAAAGQFLLVSEWKLLEGSLWWRERAENFSGLQVIPFSGDQIENSFYELERMLRRERLIK
jgi:hypothetical protein